MERYDQQLHEYLMQHLEDMTESWMKTRRNLGYPSVYSTNADERTIQLLREQNLLTNETVAWALIDRNGKFETLRDRWGIEVAQSRAESMTPTYQVLEALSNARLVFWDFVEIFVREKAVDMDVKFSLRWSKMVHEAFDSLFTTFSENYYRITKSKLQAQQELINELSAPVIPISASYGILPIIGTVDTERASFIIENVPIQCLENEVKHLFIDISGVPIVDTMVAQKIFQLTDVLTLLGIKASISGIRPEVALTSVQLGINFSGVSTYSTLKQALKNMKIDETVKA